LKAEWPGWGELHANYTRWIRKPDGLKIDQDFTAFDHPFFFTYYYDKGEAWAVVNMVSGRTRVHPASDEVDQNGGRDRLLSRACDTFYVASEVPDDSLVAATSIDRVGVVDEGDTVLLDLDKNTHLLVRRIEDGGAVSVLYDDYREKNGVKLPYRVRTFQADEEPRRSSRGLPDRREDRGRGVRGIPPETEGITGHAAAAVSE